MINGLDKSVEVRDSIESLENIGLRQPMQLSFAEISSRPSGVVRFSVSVDGIDIEGIGEGATLPEPYFTDDSGHNIVKNMNELANGVLKTDSTCRQKIEEISTYVFDDGGRYPTARLAVEMGLLDGYCKANGVSISSLLGTDEIVEVPFGQSIGAQTVEGMIDQAKESILQGSRKIKLKVSRSNLGNVVHAVSGIREEYSDIEMMVDANGGFDPEDNEDIEAIARLDSLGLIMIEEPVSRVGNVRGLAAVELLRRKLPSLATPICLDDSLETYDDCIKSLDNNLAQVVNVKPGRIGSFVQAVKLVDYAADSDKQVMVGGMLEATPGRCMTMHLGAYCLAKGFTIPGDLSLAQERLSEDLVDESRQLQRTSNGTIMMPRANGWGF
jgi:O-succinylbenzoate synthase